MIDTARLCELGLVPDALARWGMRGLVRERLHEQAQAGIVGQSAFFESLRSGPVAIATDAANAQHYEVPAEFFATVLGPRLKYSCAWYENPSVDLAEAEETMLRLSCARAGVEDGMRLLDLGCGWGSLALWLAEQYPRATVTAVSNSATQRAYIEGEARARGFRNLTVITANAVTWDTDARFDRVLSVEMFEHMRNYDALLRRVTGWLTPQGRLFTHVFCCREYGYHFAEADGWMAQNFFTGGIMPREDQFEQFPTAARLVERWWVPGTHYERTCNDWLDLLDANRAAVLDICRAAYGRADARVWRQRWRMFFMACAELFGLEGGSRFGVVHSLMEPPDRTSSAI